MKKSLTKEELAARFDGMEYVKELPDELIDAAIRNNFVIVHGDNQDMVRLDGAITDEIRAFEGAMIRFDKDGFLDCPCTNACWPCKQCLKQAKATGEVVELKAWWCGRFGDENMDALAYAMLGKPAWCFDCESIAGKFAAFNIKERQDYGEGVEYFCRAVVIDLDEIFSNPHEESMMQQKITKEELAVKLDGIEYGDGIPDDIVEAAKESKLVIIHGSSDDLIEIHGAISDEVGADTFLMLTRKGVPQSDCHDGEECAYYKRWVKRAKQTGEIRTITVFWCGDVWGGEEWLDLTPKDYDEMNGPVWCFETEMPHSNFSMYETEGDDREFFCRGIVIDLDEWFSLNYTQIMMNQGGIES